jgi:hypothetical protein
VFVLQEKCVNIGDTFAERPVYPITFIQKRLHTVIALVESPVDVRIDARAGDFTCLHRYRSVG